MAWWYSGSIADSAGGIVALTAMNNIGDKVSTIDIRVDYLNGSEPVDLFAEAEIIKNGKRIIKVDVKLYHKKEKIIAIARCAFSILRNKE